MSGAQGPVRRAVVLAVVAVALGLVAVRGVARREAAVEAEIGPIVRIVVLAREVPEDHVLRPADLAYRRMPLRWVPPRTVGRADQALGLRTAVALGAGTPLLAAVLRSTRAEAEGALASGDRVLELLATGSRRLVHTGTRVDVVQTAQRADGTQATTVVAEGVEVLEVREAPEAADDGAAQVSVTVRVARSGALRLAAAQDGGGHLRVLPRALWDKQALVDAP